MPNDAKEMYILGIESTAHTFSFGLCTEEGEPLDPCSEFVRPVEGGIHPREAAEHHATICGDLLSKLFENNSIGPDDIMAVAFSQGPGLGPCLRVGASVARTLSSSWGVPLIGVNHCVAHIEIGRQQCGCDDPVLLYASGGNTQIIAKLEGRYRVLGETLDIGIGNMLDKFAREHGIAFPGGPKIETMSLDWTGKNTESKLDGLELPYAVHGMDLSFSGLLNAAVSLVKRGKSLDAVSWSLQEHAFAACVEVAERAMAHTGKSELLLGGGVACNERLREMCDIMAKSRGGNSYVPAKKFCVDNGSMIAVLGRLQLNSGEITELENSAILQYLRTDHTAIAWT